MRDMAASSEVLPGSTAVSWEATLLGLSLIALAWAGANGIDQPIRKRG
jgi:hypothetical protein